MKPPRSAATDVGGVRTVTSPAGRLRRVMPPTEPERPAAAADQQPSSSVDEHDHTVGQFAGIRQPRQPVASSLQPPAAAVSLGDESYVELLGEQRGRYVQLGANGVAIADVVGAAARRAGPMACGQRNGVIEEEDRSPAAWRRQRMPPVPERRSAHDPQRAPVVPHDATVIVDEAAPVAGEQSSCGIGVEVTPRVDAIAAGHVTRAGPGSGGGHLGVLAGDDPPAVSLLGHHVRRPPFRAIIEGLSGQIDGSLPHGDHGDVGSHEDDVHHLVGGCRLAHRAGQDLLCELGDLLSSDQPTSPSSDPGGVVTEEAHEVLDRFPLLGVLERGDDADSCVTPGSLIVDGGRHT